MMFQPNFLHIFLIYGTELSFGGKDHYKHIEFIGLLVSVAVLSEGLGRTALNLCLLAHI